MSTLDRILRQYDKPYPVKCYHCGKQYLQREEDQIPGFREKEYDICPYCHESNGSSMEVEYHNSKLEE